ncbi:MAG: hypothetical protein ACK5RN_07590, partial [bacterium]
MVVSNRRTALLMGFLAALYPASTIAQDSREPAPEGGTMQRDARMADIRQHPHDIAQDEYV